jgi:outer membrane protein assembly factor BamB
VFASPAVAGGRVYVASCSGKVFALDRHDGSLVWSYEASADGDRTNFHGNPLISDELVIFGSDTASDGFLYAFEQESGRLRWRHAAPGGFPSNVARLEKGALAVTSSGDVWYVEIETGELLWTVEEGWDEPLYKSSVIPALGRVVVSLPTGTVFALDPDSGERIWETYFDDRLNSTLALTGDSIYVGTLSGTIHRLRLEDGERSGFFEAESPVYGMLIPAGDCLFALWAEQTLACVAPSLGGVRWSRTTDHTWSSFHPLVWGNHVVVGTDHGEIHAFERSDGSPAWTFRIEGEVKGLATSGGDLFVGTLQGRVYAIRIPVPAPRSRGTE